ncbi:transmembrane protein 241 isoform X2 [Carassius carassius]|uniref:transmembrane protein 241 isoform X2 n=1 Tax=Carassius carassius TaxID=217509 RepID=UPI002868EA9D|nr:transmembrane protein 241 isoform X2 [Carassius carassius]
MNVARVILVLVFCTFFTLSYFTNKYVLSILKFTFPTIFQGWQTSAGTLLLLVTWKLGWVEINGFSRSAAFSQLPGCFLFIGNIYAGSKALSLLPIPFFFVFQNVSEVLAFLIRTATHREKPPWMKLISVCMLLGSVSSLMLYNPRFGPSGYTWASIHLFCVGAYKVFQKNTKTILLSDLEEQFINYLTSALLLASLAHSTGDLSGALDFPLLTSFRFYTGCLGSAIFSFCLMLATVKLKGSLSQEHCGIWFFLAKILASGLSLLLSIFHAVLSPVTLCCIILNYAGEALFLYSDRFQ